MASVILADNGVVSGSAGIKSSADSSGVLALASGTGTTAVTIDASQNVGIGTSIIGSAGVSLLDSYNIGWGQGAGQSIPNLFRQVSSAATVLANGYRYTTTPNGFASSFGSSFAKTAIALNEGTIRFYADSAATTAAGTDVTPTERARIDSSGNLLVGRTSLITTASTTDTGIALSGQFNVLQAWRNGGNAMEIGRQGTDGPAVYFYKSGSTVGSISVTGSATSYVTSSDYRLKENVRPMAGALSVVQQLKPCTYTWKEGGYAGQGFIAHELQEVVPECVVGEKDAVDADGNPVYQGIDTSFLVATLTAAIQEQQALITTLTERITALEAK